MTRSGALALRDPRAFFETGAAATASSHVSANVLQSKTRSHEASQPYQPERGGACMKNSKKLHSCLHLGGSLKIPLADALRRSTFRMRSAAREIALACGKSERTASNYLSGLTEMGITDAIRLANSFREVRQIILDAITPDEKSLADELAELQVLQARVEARLREELHVHVSLQMDAAHSFMAVQKAVAQGHAADGSRECDGKARGAAQAPGGLLGHAFIAERNRS